MCFHMAIKIILSSKGHTTNGAFEWFVTIVYFQMTSKTSFKTKTQIAKMAFVGVGTGVFYFMSC